MRTSTRHFFLFVFAFCLIVHIAGAQGQENILDKKIHVSFRKEPLYKALIRINQITGYKFSYNSDIVNEDKPVSIKAEEWKIRTCLDSLINDTSLVYQVINQHIVIHKKSETPQEPLTKEKKPRFITLNGIVLDEITGEPLSYANVSIFNKSLGTISNADGEFVLNLNHRHLDDTLVVSFMGYRNRFIPVSEFQDSSSIKMERKLYTIQEVIVRTFDADMILQEAFQRARGNYFFEPIVSTGFYRESIKRDKEYTTVSEAVVDMYKPYNKIFQSPKIKILKSRKTTDIRRKDSITLKLKAGLEAVLFLDVIHENISFFNSSAFQNYEYHVANISHFDGHNTYVIDFEPSRKTEMPLYSGKLYVDVNTLALVSAEFHLNKENLDKVAASLIIKKKWNIRVKPQSVEYYINYRRIRDKYFLNQIRGDLTFKIRRKNHLLADDFQVTFNMFVSHVDTSNVSRFERDNLFQPHKVFIEQIREYDASFWGEYNYIKPDEPLRETVSRLGSKIKTLQKK